MIEIRYEHEATTKNWERFKPILPQNEVKGVTPILAGAIYLPLGTNKEGFTVTIHKEIR